MKRIALLLFISLSACTFTKQQKAERIIKDYLLVHLNDPNSYERVSFGKLDSAYSTLEDDSIYTRSVKRIAQYQTEFDDWKIKNPDFDGLSELSDSQTKYFIKMNNLYSGLIIYEMKIRDAASLKFNPKYKGWHLSHIYRAKNGFGALGLHQTMFTIDSAFTKVIDSEEIK